MASDESIERRLFELRRLSADYAKAEARRTYLVEYRKSKKALLMQKAEMAGIETGAKQERDAYADSEYRELLLGLQEATEQAERLRWELEVARMGVDLFRTQQANQRAERKGYGA